MTTTVVEDLGAIRIWQTIQTMNWSPEEAHNKFAPGPGVATPTLKGVHSLVAAAAPATAVMAATAVRIMESQNRPHIEQAECFFWMKVTNRTTFTMMARAAQALVAVKAPQGPGGRQTDEGEVSQFQG